MAVTLEICCGSAADVFTAAEAGANRVELNSALYLGGLTPSIGSVRLARNADIPIMAMLRPRDGGFCYSEEEINTMLADMSAFIDEGIGGFVFGVLTADGRVDPLRNARLIAAAQGRECVFHRAIDVCPDWREALNTLIELGFKRVLTSGQAPNAIEGMDMIKQMVDYAAGRIEILPGGGVRPNNAQILLDYTGCTQLHSSCSSAAEDNSLLGNPAITFRGSSPENKYTYCDIEKVRALLRVR